MHVQEATAALILGEFELAGHAMHVVTVVAATVTEYVPVTQCVHRAEPVVSLYVPAAHVEHVEPSGPVYPLLQAGLTQAALEELAIGEV